MLFSDVQKCWSAFLLTSKRAGLVVILVHGLCKAQLIVSLLQLHKCVSIREELLITVNSNTNNMKPDFPNL